MLIWMNFDSFGITYLNEKFQIVLNSLQTQTGPGNTIINRLSLIPKLFNKMYSFFMLRHLMTL